MEDEETVILDRAEMEAVFNREDEVTQHLDKIAEVLSHFAENVNRVSAQARLMNMDHDARRALVLYAGLTGALMFFKRERKMG